MMIDIATAEAEIKERSRQQQRSAHIQQSSPYLPATSHAHRYMPQPTTYQSHQNPYHYQSFQNYGPSAVNHTNISPILNGTSLASARTSTPLTSTNSASIASTPAYSKSSSPRSTSMHLSPKVQCSLCYTQVDIAQSLACTECINGFCQGCVQASETLDRHDHDMDGTFDIGGLSKMRLGSSPELEPRDSECHSSVRKRTTTRETGTRGRNSNNRCGVCGVFGARYKPVRLVVRV
ncbi:hypothetical protein BDZ91DRAFT_54239 [Kalaharituber pfeilii]|nr:hypothetical protein BDZ91DRAFT_54239 [Kalaharituber pfeilii]